MSSQLTPTAVSQQAALAEFLHSVFRGSARVNSFDPDVLAWKYFSSHPEWTGARSYVATANDNIVGHAGIWPVQLSDSARQISAIHLIDWAASRTQAGVGVMLLRKLAGLADLLLTIGGSAETQAILPKMGYRRCGVLKIQARVVNPMRQVTRKYPWHWKTPPRALRNIMWSARSLPEMPKGWTVSPVNSFDESMSQILSAERPRFAVRRSVDGLNHLLTCPGAKFSAFIVARAQAIRGYFVLSEAFGQVRIVDLGTAAKDNESLSSICIVAARTAAGMPGAREIVAGFSCENVQQVFAVMGFRTRQLAPVFGYDPRKVLGGGSIVNLSMSDGDLCFLSNAERPYLT